MAWLFLIGAAFFILGGLLSVQPSKTQKRIALLRETAMHKGLHVKLPVSLKFPEGVIKSSRPYYCKNMNDRRLAHQFAHVLRTDEGEIICSHKLNSSLESLFQKKLVGLPENYKAIYLGSGLLGLSWNEATEDEVPQVLLDSLSEIESEIGAKVVAKA